MCLYPGWPSGFTIELVLGLLAERSSGGQLSRPSLLDALREVAGTDLSDEFAAAVAGSSETAAKVADSLMSWANEPGSVPEMEIRELRPFVDTTWTKLFARKAQHGTPATGEILSPVGDQVSLFNPTAERMLKLLLLYCHRVVIPVDYVGLIPREWLIEGRDVLARMVRFYSHLALLIDAGVVIPVLNRDEPDEARRALDLAMLADARGSKGGRKDPLGPIPAEVLAEIGCESHEWYRDTRLRIVCRSIVHSQAILEQIDNRGCLLLPGRRWANVVNFAGVEAARLGAAIDEGAIITELLNAHLPALDDQRLPFSDICVLRKSDVFEQWRDQLAAALDHSSSASGVDWSAASTRMVEATEKLRRSLRRSSRREFTRNTRAHFGVLGAGAAITAPLHLLAPPVVAIEGGIVGAVATIEWFRLAHKNKPVQRSLAHHAALFELPAPAG